jgi:preprotein translocase subunit Sss1
VRQPLKDDLIIPWVVTGMMFFMLLSYIVACHLMADQLQQHWLEDQRVLIRTTFYVIAIVLFPVTNLIRHIQLRLNETMPGATPAKRRYLFTVIVSMVLIESVGVLGFVMFLLGDDYNTLYIFNGLSMLGLFLYRPKSNEYSKVIKALAAQKNEGLARQC